MISRNDEVVLASWVHLSDIHFGHGTQSHQWDQQLVIDDLRRDIQSLCASRVPPPTHVFVTGDIAFSGGARTPAAGKAEYDLAARWLDDLLHDLALPRARVFLVPGNHDVDRAMDDDVATMVAQARQDMRGFQLDDLLGKSKQVERLCQRMAHFLEFARCFGPDDLERFHGGLWWRHRSDLGEGLSLRICGLNTSTLSADDQDQGKLRVGNRQLVDLFVPAPGKDEITLVLSHHPPTSKWLADESTVRSRLEQASAIHLFGHLHEADSEQARRGWGGGGLRIAAGAAHAEAAHAGEPLGHGYNFGALVVLPDGELLTRIWPRKWSSRSSKFSADVENLEEERGCAEHRLGRRVARMPQSAALERSTPSTRVETPSPTRVAGDIDVEEGVSVLAILAFWVGGHAVSTLLMMCFILSRLREFVTDTLTVGAVAVAGPLGFLGGRLIGDAPYLITGLLLYIFSSRVRAWRAPVEVMGYLAMQETLAAFVPPCIDKGDRWLHVFVILNGGKFADKAAMNLFVGNICGYACVAISALIYIVRRPHIRVRILSMLRAVRQPSR